MEALQPLLPLPTRLGLHDRFCAVQPSVLVMKEKLSWSAGDFVIQTTEGQDVVRVTGRTFSMSARREFASPEGELLYSLRKEIVSLLGAWYLEAPTGEKLLGIRNRWSFAKTKMDARFDNLLGGGQEVVLEIRGNFWSRRCEICWDGRPVARLREDIFGLRSVFGGLNTYFVEIAPGVDMAMIAALVMGLDEHRDAQRNSA